MKIKEKIEQITHRHISHDFVVGCLSLLGKYYGYNIECSMGRGDSGADCVWKEKTPFGWSNLIHFEVVKSESQSIKLFKKINSGLKIRLDIKKKTNSGSELIYNYKTISWEDLINKFSKLIPENQFLSMIKLAYENQTDKYFFENFPEGAFQKK